MNAPPLKMPPFRGGLRLPAGGPGLGKAAAQVGHAQWRTAEDVEREFVSKGFTDIPQPAFECPQITPEMLAGTDAQAYTAMFVRVNAWLSYATDILAKLKTRILELENLKKILAANARRDARAAASAAPDRKKPTIQEQEDSLLLDPEYQKVILDLQRLDQGREYYQSRVDMLDSTWRVISRQVEIRRQELEGNSHSQNGPNGRVNPKWSR